MLQQRWQPHMQPPAPPLPASPAEEVRSQQRLRPQTGRPAPQARGRRKANLSALSRSASAGGAPPVDEVQLAGDAEYEDTLTAAAAANAAGGGDGIVDEEAAAKALRRHTLLREKNRRAQANARRRKKVPTASLQSLQML
jgi:hypothetical protein